MGARVGRSVHRGRRVRLAAMPELPEVEAARQLVQSHCAGKRIAQAHLLEAGGGPRTGQFDEIVFGDPDATSENVVREMAAAAPCCAAALPACCDCSECWWLLQAAALVGRTVTGTGRKVRWPPAP